MAGKTISPGETRPAAVGVPRDIPPDERPVAANRPPWFTRLTLGAIEGERDERVQRRPSRPRRIENGQVTRIRFPRLAAAYAAEAPAAGVAQIAQDRSSDEVRPVDPGVRSRPVDPSVASDVDRERFAIRKLLTKMTGEEHRLERLGHTFDADEQETKDGIERTWRQEHWGQAPTRPPSWRHGPKIAPGAE